MVVYGTPPAADKEAIARLYGEPFYTLPHDLYIPPDALEVILEAFEGPLDLLLYLIRKQNFNILDIPMAGLTRQYLIYVDEIRQSNLELAADYLLMAAMLIEIKSRMLLPVQPVADGQETDDPRSELVRRLLQYEQMKQAAAQLDALPRSGRDFLVAQASVERLARWPTVSVDDLHAAWTTILQRARLVQHHTITHEELSVREWMSLILKRLQEHRFVVFEALFDPAKGAPVLIVTLMALLELAKETLIDITQAEGFAPIYIRLAQK